MSKKKETQVQKYSKMVFEDFQEKVREDFKITGEMYSKAAQHNAEGINRILSSLWELKKFQWIVVVPLNVILLMLLVILLAKLQ